MQRVLSTSTALSNVCVLRWRSSRTRTNSDRRFITSSSGTIPSWRCTTGRTSSSLLAVETARPIKAHLRKSTFSQESEVTTQVHLIPTARAATRHLVVSSTNIEKCRWCLSQPLLLSRTSLQAQKWVRAMWTSIFISRPSRTGNMERLRHLLLLSTQVTRRCTTRGTSQAMSSGRKGTSISSGLSRVEAISSSLLPIID